MSGILADYREWAAASQPASVRTATDATCGIQSAWSTGWPERLEEAELTDAEREAVASFDRCRSTPLTAWSYRRYCDRMVATLRGCWRELSKSDSLWRANRMRKTTENVSQDI
jgi:hypothetical protein